MGGYITTGTDYGILNGFSLVKLHGWFMYVAWGVLGWLQAASNRYFKKNWRTYIIVHRICGTLILLITISMGVIGIELDTWTFT